MRPDFLGRRFLGGESSRVAAVSFLPGNYAVAQDSDTLDLTFHHVANLKIPGFGIAIERGSSRDLAGREHIARTVTHSGIVRKSSSDIQRYLGIRILPGLAVDPQFHGQILRIRKLVSGHDPRPQRTERINSFA